MRGSSRSKSREAFLDARRPLPHGFFGFAGPSRESFTTIPSSITLSYSIAQAASYDYEFALELTSLFFPFPFHSLSFELFSPNFTSPKPTSQLSHPTNIRPYRLSES